MGTPIFDLTGLLNIQKSYLDSLSYASGNNLNVSGMINDLQGNLNAMNTSYQQSNGYVQGLLTQQNAMQDMIQRENERLTLKKNVIDNTLNGKIRAAQLNESYRKKRAAYMKILITICVTIVLYMIFSYLPNYFPFLSGFMNILMIILFSISIIYILFIIKEIYTRENINYDRLDIAPPKMKSNADILASQLDAANSGNLLGTLSDPDQCVGPSCCEATNSRWSVDVNKCIPLYDNGEGPFYDATTRNAVKTCSGVICDNNVCLPSGSSCKIKVETFDDMNLGNIKTYDRPSDNLNYSLL